MNCVDDDVDVYDRAGKPKGISHQMEQTCRVNRMLLWTHESNDASLSDQNDVKGILIAYERRVL